MKKLWLAFLKLIGFPTAEPEQPPVVTPPVVVDPPVIDPPTWTLPDTFHGLNGARAMRSGLKAAGKHWYELDLGLFSKQGGAFQVFRNGGTVTMGSRFDPNKPGNAYANSVGTWPAIFSPERRAEIGTIPSLAEFVSDYELKIDAREPDNYHYNIKQAQILNGFKILYVANPFQDAAELRAVIQYFGANNLVGIVAGNELNSPKAVRYGITPEDVTYWAATLKPVCQEFGLQLGIGLPPYEYVDNELKGIALNGKLASDKRFAEHIKANTSLFDFVCFHPYGQLPAKDKALPFEQYVNGVILPDDYEFLKVQVAHFHGMFGLPMYADEHGLENPEYGHVNSDLAVNWHINRGNALVQLATEFPLMGSCFQVLLGDVIEGQPQSLLYVENDKFVKSRELQAMLDTF